jgi:hypothetical protein
MGEGNPVMRTVCWNEQDESGNDVVIERTEDWCIREQKILAIHRGIEFESDEAAIQDFMTVHWAWFKEEP